MTVGVGATSCPAVGVGAVTEGVVGVEVAAPAANQTAVVEAVLAEVKVRTYNRNKAYEKEGIIKK